MKDEDGVAEGGSTGTGGGRAKGRSGLHRKCGRIRNRLHISARGQGLEGGIHMDRYMRRDGRGRGGGVRWGKVGRHTHSVLVTKEIWATAPCNRALSATLPKRATLPSQKHHLLAWTGV